MNENYNPLFEDEEKNISSEAPEYAEANNPSGQSENFFSQTVNPEAMQEIPDEALPEVLPSEPVEAADSYIPVIDEDVTPDFSPVSNEEPSPFNAEGAPAPVSDEPTEAEASAFPAEDNTFNPYAPKTPSADNYNNYSTNTFNQNPEYKAPAQNQVNPSYNQPLNQNYNQNYNQGGYNPNNAPVYNNGAFSPYQPPAPKNNKNGKIALFAIIGVCVFVGIIALVSSLFSGGSDNGDIASTTNGSFTETTSDSFGEATTSTTSSINTVVATTQSYDQNINSIWVAEKVRPSVAGVLAYKQGELAGEGSGVLMREDKANNCTYVITCAHVINEPGCEFAILLLDGRTYEAHIVALDERTDIGVLKVSATGLPLAEFGDSSSLKIGEPIYAIGNPGGSEYFGSITNGIIAAIDRSINATYTMTCIQHNAAINPGNSGGALVNTAGQVIGINSSKIARTDYEGMGFAVPSAIFTSVVDDLIQYGYVPNRPELGIKYASVSDYQLYSLIVSIKGLPRESIIIAEIPEGSALSGTQAQVGDLIIAVNGKKMDSSDVLLDLIDTGAVGDALTLTLCRVQERSYETSTFDVTVQLVEDKGSMTTTTQPVTLPSQGNYSDFEDFFDFFGW